MSDRPAGYAGYTQPIEGEEDAEITHVGRGTPCGEYLRRYWHPVALEQEICDLPLAVRLLGEDLVLFRDGGRRYGLLHRHCSHRGASLEFGIVAERGIVCCYHGWHYDVDGRILRAGSEPADSPIPSKVVHGAYPTHAHHGIVFAYLGPAQHKPPCPVYDTEFQPDVERRAFRITTPCNWLQVYENTQDPIHVLHLHARVSGVQFGEASGIDQIIEYQDTPLGMINVQTRHVGRRAWVRTVETILPNVNQTGAIWEEAEQEKYFQRAATLRWMVPVDDTTTRTIGWRFHGPRLDPRGQDHLDDVGIESIDFIGQTADERPYEERQRQPGDYEAQVSQRPIAVHALEHRATSDRGVAALRRRLRDRIRALAAGEPVSQPARGASERVPTCCQDTVCAWGGEACEAALRAYGRQVAAAVLETQHLEPAAREAEVRRRCERPLAGAATP